jgi:uncharacterized repeat protein (TIGR02543 family)
VAVTGGHIASPADPTRASYIFGGWYKEASCTNIFDFTNETVTNDVTLYAKWTANIPLVWDGSIDVSWYNTTDTVFYINTPAQLAGLAAIVNGLYNPGATVTGNADYIHANSGSYSLVGGVYATTYWGDDSFKGKTILPHGRSGYGRRIRQRYRYLERT